MIYLGADHNGFALKEKIKPYLAKLGLSVVDCGAFEYKKADDYVDFARNVSGSIKSGDLGILICGSGHGMVIAANKVGGIRAILPLNSQSARDGRHDDHSNVLVLAAWETDLREARKIIEAFLKTRPSDSPRFIRRLQKIKRMEK